MKIATYNIHYGGKSLHHWKKLITETKCDLIFFQETVSPKLHLEGKGFEKYLKHTVWGFPGDKELDKKIWASGIYCGNCEIKKITVRNFEGWVVGAKIKNSENGEGWLLQLENIKENGRFSKSYKYLISQSDYEEWTKNIEVREGDCLITNVGRIAAVAQIPRVVKAALGRNMTAVRPEKIPASFLIQYLLSPHMQEEVIKKQDFGAIMGALNVRAINKLEIIIPSKELLGVFDNIVGVIRIEIWNLLEQTELLTTFRDRLLSRLMSGKIDLENLDIQFPASMNALSEVEGNDGACNA